MTKAQLTHHELDAALRNAGCASVEEVHSAILENNGKITVLQNINVNPETLNKRNPNT